MRPYTCVTQVACKLLEWACWSDDVDQCLAPQHDLQLKKAVAACAAQLSIAIAYPEPLGGLGAVIFVAEEAAANVRKHRHLGRCVTCGVPERCTAVQPCASSPLVLCHTATPVVQCHELVQAAAAAHTQHQRGHQPGLSLASPASASRCTIAPLAARGVAREPHTHALLLPQLEALQVQLQAFLLLRRLHLKLNKGDLEEEDSLVKDICAPKGGMERGQSLVLGKYAWFPATVSSSATAATGDGGAAGVGKLQRVALVLGQTFFVRQL